ncbi:MAG TPA: TetR/AcrR family transcriptional regulator [bacterium]|nr:TetR/AcrR family transcriptional regulator [bacterium]
MARLNELRKEQWDEIMRRSIYRVTVGLLNDRGLGGLTMARVAKAAEVSTGTLYNYVKDKDDLLSHVIDMTFEPIRRAIVAISERVLSPPDKLRALIVVIFKGFEDNKAMIAIMYQATASTLAAQRRKASIQETLLDMVLSILDEGMREGCFRQCDRVLAGRLIMAIMDGYLLSALDGGDRVGVGEKEALACADLLLNGLSTRSQADTRKGPDATNAAKRGK